MAGAGVAALVVGSTAEEIARERVRARPHVAVALHASGSTGTSELRRNARVEVGVKHLLGRHGATLGDRQRVVLFDLVGVLIGSRGHVHRGHSYGNGNRIAVRRSVVGTVREGIVAEETGIGRIRERAIAAENQGAIRGVPD